MSFYYRLPEIEIIDLRTIVLNFQFLVEGKFTINSFYFQPFDFQIPIPQIISFQITDIQQITCTVTSLWPLVRYRLSILDFFPSEQNTISFLTLSDENQIRDRMVQRYENNIYNLEQDTINWKIIDHESHDLRKAKKDIWETKNQNYLNFLVSDELHSRGIGPFDFLHEESAYHVVRVGREPSQSLQLKTINFSSFPSLPVALQQEEVSEILTQQRFENLIFAIKKQNIIDLIAIKFIYSNGDEFEYSISRYGFQLQNAKYSKYGKVFLTLKENEFRLNDQILENPSFQFPTNNDKVEVTYLTQNFGEEIDYSNLDIYSIKKQIREAVPPIITKFDLKFGNLISENDEILTEGGISFLDPNASPPLSSFHPAFLTEIPFDLSNPPNKIGQYSVDYSTGRVLVYGAETNDGTGAYPPLATYFYRFYFQSELDFNFDQINNELTANPTRNLIGEEVKVSFSYSTVFIPGIDYRPLVHSEILEERIENRLKNNRSLSVKNIPITNVFRLYNETTGEIYKIERWNDSTVYFSGNIDPKISKIEQERINFLSIKNEKLNVFSNSNPNLFVFQLQKEKISNATEDGLGTSFNSSIILSRQDLFQTERYFDSALDLETNLNFLTSFGEYCVNYEKGILYLFLETEENDFGSINYLTLTIETEFAHILTVDDIYFSSAPNIKTKKINYSSFSDTEVTFEKYYLSAERFDSSNVPYIYSQGKIIVQDNIFELRGVFDHYQISNQQTPLNFASVAEFENNEITISSGLSQKNNLTIKSGLILEFPFYSPGIEIQNVVSIVRISDGAELEGTLLPDQTFAFSGANSPAEGELVEVIYNLILNGAATPIVDYSRGEFFLDYEYLADEILISYEFGPNCLDFSSNTTFFPGEKYYVSYLVGALRDGLINNFGSFVKIPVLQNVDLTLSRERYRDALAAVLQAFPKGITLEALKLAISNITHIEPNIKEAAFLLWSLGESQLYRSKIYHSGNMQLLPGKYDCGVLFSSVDDYLEFPLSSHCSLESGTIEFWATPTWKGLDNLAVLTCKLELNNELISSDQIFLGTESKNPECDLNGKFSFSKNDALGLPGKIFTEQIGYFIYFDEENNRWKLLVKCSTAEVNKFSGKIWTSGDFYSVEGIPELIEINDVIRTTNTRIDFQFYLDIEDYTNPDGYDGYDGYQSGYSFDGLQFCSDEQNYFFDAGDKQNLNENRISLYRDGQGYLNFRVYSSGPKRIESKISADISNWKSLEPHFISATWKLNTDEQRDELHLFIDGQEIPNILRYGGKPDATSSDRFRTIIPETVIGTISRPIIGGNDLVLTANSTSVFSTTLNFSDLGVLAGDTISILESGLSSYTILTVNQDTLILDSIIPFSLTEVKFSINPIEFTVQSAIHLAPNFIVTRLADSEEEELFGLRSTNPDYSLTRNLAGENILTILNRAKPGDQILVRTLGLNFRILKDEKYIYGPTSILRTQLLPPVNLDEVKIKKCLLPPTQCKISNSIGLTFTNSISGFYDVTNTTEGRQVTCSITGQNVNFSTPVTVILYGSNFNGTVSETLEFASPGKLTTNNKFTFLDYFDISFLRWEEKEALVISFEETYSVTESNGNEEYAVVRYSIPTINGSNLESISASQAKDENQFFIASQVGEKLIISSPISVAGTYEITNVIDSQTIEVAPEFTSSFSSGVYQTYSLLDARAGLQNGYFFFQKSGTINEPFFLSTGYYKIEYPIYLSVPLNPLNGSEKIRLGASLENEFSARAILDHFVILSSELTDVRKGEVSSVRNITSDFYSILPSEITAETLTYIDCNTLPIIDQAENWIRRDKKYLQTSPSINENFNLALNLSFSPLKIDNLGYLNQDQGTIEFWVNPNIDTFNDRKKRYYFDASSAKNEEIISSSKTKIVLSSNASQILDLRFKNQQLIPGKYELLSDQKTIELQIPLQYYNTPIVAHYIPSSIIGNRISIYKDEFGYLVFEIQFGEKIFALRQPIFWARNTWHRVMATYSCNQMQNKDFMRLFIDGEEKSNLLFGSGILFGSGEKFGATNNFSGGLKGNIIFTDVINSLIFGADFRVQTSGFCSMDNIRLSNIARSPIIIAEQAKDLHYNSNREFCFPVTEDLYTTAIIDFDSQTSKKDDFSLLKNKNYGLSNFEIQVIDSFDIVLNDEKIKKILETIINLIKPAHSKTKISYIQ